MKRVALNISEHEYEAIRTVMRYAIRRLARNRPLQNAQRRIWLESIYVAITIADPIKPGSPLRNLPSFLKRQAE